MTLAITNSKRAFDLFKIYHKHVTNLAALVHHDHFVDTNSRFKNQQPSYLNKNVSILTRNIKHITCCCIRYNSQKSTTSYFSRPINDQTIKKSPVLMDKELQELKESISSLVFENKEIEAIFNDLLKSAIEIPTLHFDIFQSLSPNISSSTINKNTLKKLESKLKFKLGFIINLLRKQTNASQKHFLNDSSEVKHLTNILISHINTKNTKLITNENESSTKNKDDNKNLLKNDELDLEFEAELLGLNNKEYENIFNNSGMVPGRLDSVIYNPDDINQWNFFNSFEDEGDDDEEVVVLDSCGIDLKDDLRTSVEELERLNKFHQFNSILFEHGVCLDDQLDNKKSNLFVEYREDIIGSIEKEIKQKADELRPQFPGIDKCIKDLKVCIAKEWIIKYENELDINKKSNVNTLKYSSSLNYLFNLTNNTEETKK